MTVSKKELIQYITALLFLFSGILMCFLSFFLNNYGIENSVLAYLGQAVIFTAGVFSINIYVRQKILESETRLDQKIDSKMRKVDDLIADEI